LPAPGPTFRTLPCGTEPVAPGRRSWACSSWKAFFFGSLDSSNFITVDKPPASLWVMELSGRIFGFNSLSMLIPEALEGVATVALTYAIIRRWYGHRVGLIAGVLMATTPVAALMFRFNNPDALLVLLLTAAAYCVTRALEKASTRWILLAGVAIGFAFLTKMGQALLVVPGFGGAYLIAAPTSLRRRAGQLVAALAAVVVSAGWWVLIVTVWPADARPMIDGSPTNSIWNLIVGYNGLDRLVSGTSGGGNFSGATGLGRLFNSLMGGQASWLLPAAMLTLVATWSPDRHRHRGGCRGHSIDRRSGRLRAADGQHRHQWCPPLSGPGHQRRLHVRGGWRQGRGTERRRLRLRPQRLGPPGR